MPESLANPLEQLSLDQLRRRTSRKWRHYPADVLPLWVAEMDVALAEPVTRALQKAIALGDTGYPTTTQYGDAFARFAARRWGWSDLDVSQTAIVADVMVGIVEVLRLVTEPGDAVVVNSPVYPPFFAFVGHADRRVVTARLNDDGRIDLAALDEAFRAARSTGRRAAYLMSNPHNPTGVVHARSELEAVAALADRHDVRVIVDEIHGPLVLPDAGFTPYLTVAGAENAWSVTSASKAWNLAGLKAGLIVAGRQSLDDLARLPEEVSHGPSHLGVLAHTAALEDGEPWLDALLQGLDHNRSVLERLIAEHLPQVGFRAPEGTYLAWLDCRGLGLHDPDEAGPGVVSDLAGPARFFLEEAKVALSSGHAFGDGGAGHVRLNYATSTATLTEAVTRMGRAVTDRG